MAEENKLISKSPDEIAEIFDLKRQLSQIDLDSGKDYLQLDLPSQKTTAGAEVKHIIAAGVAAANPRVLSGRDTQRTIRLIDIADVEETRNFLEVAKLLVANWPAKTLSYEDTKKAFNPIRACLLELARHPLLLTDADLHLGKLVSATSDDNIWGTVTDNFLVAYTKAKSNESLRKQIRKRLDEISPIESDVYDPYDLNENILLGDSHTAIHAARILVQSGEPVHEIMEERFSILEGNLKATEFLEWVKMDSRFSRYSSIADSLETKLHSFMQDTNTKISECNKLLELQDLDIITMNNFLEMQATYPEIFLGWDNEFEANLAKKMGGQINNYDYSIDTDRRSLSHLLALFNKTQVDIFPEDKRNIKISPKNLVLYVSDNDRATIKTILEDPSPLANQTKWRDKVFDSADGLRALIENKVFSPPELLDLTPENATSIARVADMDDSTVVDHLLSSWETRFSPHDFAENDFFFRSISEAQQQKLITVLENNFLSQKVNEISDPPIQPFAERLLLSGLTNEQAKPFVKHYLNSVLPNIPLQALLDDGTIDLDPGTFDSTQLFAEIVDELPSFGVTNAASNAPSTIGLPKPITQD